MTVSKKTEEKDTENKENTGSSKLKDLVAPFVAMIALGGFAWIVFDLFGKLNAEELQWTRAMSLLSGVEAIAFAGAGYLFGSEVHRKQAESAEKKAEKAEEKAQESEQAATNGKILAESVKAKSAELDKMNDSLAELGPKGLSLVNEFEVNQLGTLANNLFPDN